MAGAGSTSLTPHPAPCTNKCSSVQRTESRPWVSPGLVGLDIAQRRLDGVARGPWWRVGHEGLEVDPSLGAAAQPQQQEAAVTQLVEVPGRHQQEQVDGAQAA